MYYHAISHTCIHYSTLKYCNCIFHMPQILKIQNNKQDLRTVSAFQLKGVHVCFQFHQATFIPVLSEGDMLYTIQTKFSVGPYCPRRAFYINPPSFSETNYMCTDYFSPSFAGMHLFVNIILDTGELNQSSNSF